VHLGNWHDKDHPLVEIHDERWMLKPEGGREVLATLLGGTRLNIAEARPWGRTGDGARAAVRLAENYRLGDLLISDLDEAVASEMVFSAWTRRRDSHAFNRAYVRGVPIFFDNGVAFDPTQSLEDFMQTGPDFGYVPSWRVAPGSRYPRTMPVRRATIAANLALHPIHDPAAFVVQVERWITTITRISDGEIEAAVARAGLEEDVVGMLRRSRAELPGAMERILPIALGDLA
jgi:hypothetical protein